jgi:hypothetical protein
VSANATTAEERFAKLSIHWGKRLIYWLSHPTTSNSSALAGPVQFWNTI